MSVLFEWPEAAKFDRVIPKSRVLGQVKANRALKDRFAREAERIVWSHKLAPETINLKLSKAAPEIQIIRISLRVKNYHIDLLRAIDRAIPFPLIFELMIGDKTKLAAAWKRPSEAGSAKWVSTEHFQGRWVNENSPRSPLPTALNMQALYERLLAPLVDVHVAILLASIGSDFTESVYEAPVSHYNLGEAAQTSRLEDRISSAEAVRATVREIKRVKVRLAREKQYNRRVEINSELRATMRELRKLAENFHRAA